MLSQQGFKVLGQFGVLALASLDLQLSRSVSTVNFVRDLNLRVPRLAGKFLYQNSIILYAALLNNLLLA